MQKFTRPCSFFKLAPPRVTFLKKKKKHFQIWSRECVYHISGLYRLLYVLEGEDRHPFGHTSMQVKLRTSPTTCSPPVDFEKSKGHVEGFQCSQKSKRFLNFFLKFLHFLHLFLCIQGSCKGGKLYEIYLRIFKALSHLPSLQLGSSTINLEDCIASLFFSEINYINHLFTYSINLPKEI